MSECSPGFGSHPEVIVLAVRWYVRFALSYRDVKELLAERDVDVDHVTVYRWVRRSGELHFSYGEIGRSATWSCTPGTRNWSVGMTR